MPTLEDALRYAKAGRAIFPCYEIREDGSCACGEDCGRNAGKHPYGSSKRAIHYADLKNGALDATANEETIRLWWTRWPGANIGLATGPINRLVVFDFDGEAGLANYKSLMNGTKPEDTLSVDTGGGGLHLYFKTNRPFPNKRNLLGEGSGVDVRGKSGYVMAPPSNHRSGVQYSFRAQRKPLDLPEYLERRFDALSDDKEENKAPLGESDWTRVVNDGEGRDDYLIRMAGSLARSSMPYRELAGTLWRLNQQNVKPPKTKRDIVRITKSAIRMEKRRREKEGTPEILLTPAEILKEGGIEEPDEGFFVDSRYVERTFAGKQTDWLIKSWIPEASLGLMLAPPELYKTWTLLDLMLTLAGARPLFLDLYPALQTGTIMFFQQEDSFSRLWERVAKILNVGEPIRKGDFIEIPMPPDYPKIIWHVRRELQLRDKQSLLNLDRGIKKYDPLLIGIDPMYSIMELKDYGAETAKEMGVFKIMRDLYGVTFLIVHHMKKGENAGRARDSGWGSQFLNAWQEFGIEIMPTVQDGRVTIERHEKNSQRPPNLDVQFHITDWSYAVDVEEEQPDEFMEKMEIIRELLQTTLVKSYAEVMSKTGISSKSTVNKLFKLLGVEKEGHYYKIGAAQATDIRMVRGGKDDD